MPGNIFYGANFVDYIGYVEKPITVVRPVNGLYYDTFIMEQYFGTFIDGAVAADDLTKAFLAAMKLLPETVSLSDKPLVEAAAAAYNLIASNEQRGITEVMAEYARLLEAQKRIANLEYLEQGETPPTPETTPTPTPETPAEQIDKLTVVTVVATVSSLVAVLLLAFVVAQSIHRHRHAPKPQKAPKTKDKKVKETKSEDKAAEAEKTEAEAKETTEHQTEEEGKEA